MTGLFPDSKEAVIHVPAGCCREVPMVCEIEGNYVCRATVAKGAKLHICAFVLAGRGKVSLSLEVDLTAPGAELHLDGLYIASNEGHADIEVKVDHSAPDCMSRQTVKGIAAGSATGSFTGMIHVARDAQRTDAAQYNRNLQLDETAHVFTRPQLEIYADDVKCSHGATVGQPDEEAIYYMRQRGVGERDARRMQMQGFVDDVINRCPTEDFRKLIAGKIDKVIGDF